MALRDVFRSSASCILCGLVALFATGLPLSHAADHQSASTHMEHDHGGHGVVLLEYDEQLLSKTLDLSAAAVPVLPRLSEAEAVFECPFQERPFPHKGRDPPKVCRPRAPPILLS